MLKNGTSFNTHELKTLDRSSRLTEWCRRRSQHSENVLNDDTKFNTHKLKTQDRTSLGLKKVTAFTGNTAVYHSKMPSVIHAASPIKGDRSQGTGRVVKGELQSPFGYAHAHANRKPPPPSHAIFVLRINSLQTK